MKKKRVAIYARVSTSEQSTELQLRELNAYVEARGWELVHVYEEQLSGRSGERAQLKEMLSAARKRKFDILLIWKLDRLFRSLKGIVTSLEEFEELGIQLVSLKENIDLTTSSGRLMVHLISAFAQFEADLIRERVCAGLENARAKGKKLGRPPRIDRDKVTNLRAQGLSMSQIAKELGCTKSAVSKSLKK